MLADHAEGVRREVIGSPHFFTPSGDFFCPSLDVTHDPTGGLQVRFDPESFETFYTRELPRLLVLARALAGDLAADLVHGERDRVTAPVEA